MGGTDRQRFLLKNVEFEATQHPSTLSVSQFWNECDKALVDTFYLKGVYVGRVLVKKCPVSDITELVDGLKSWVAYWLPHVLKDDTPPQFFSDPYEILDSAFRRYWRNRMTSKKSRRRNMELASLMLYSKRLFPKLPESIVEQKIEKYLDGLSRPLPNKYNCSHRIEEEIHVSVQELGEERMVADYTVPFAPSTSSCFESSRKDGGLQGFVRENVMTSNFREDHPFLRSVEECEEEVLKFFDPDLMTWDGVWTDLLNQLLDTAEETEGGQGYYGARVAGIPEPLKVRLVTRQSWILGLLGPIQKAWHKRMRETEIYQLIGGVPVSDAIKGLELELGQKVVSGDYAAATDEIFLRYTKYAAEQMLSVTDIKLPTRLVQFEPLIRRIAIESLTNIKVTVGHRTVPVTRGQMMGHILSFPLLCLLNRSASCCAIPRERFMRINGDDVLFPANSTEYSLWKAKTRNVGLKFSLGKNYYSEHLALINSEFFVPNGKDWTPMRVPNLGLMGYQYEMIDRDSGVQILPWDQYGAIWSAFEKTLDPGMWKAGFSLFKRRYPVLEKFRGPVFGPRELGCLGGKVPEGFEYSRTERMWMSAHQQGLFNFRDGVMTDYSRIQSVFQDKLKGWGCKVLGDLQYGVPPSNQTLPPIDVFPDPFSRCGGHGNRIMVCRRWLVKPTPLKKIRIFGERRWRRFLKESGFNQVLGGAALSSVLENCYSSQRRFWYREGLYRELGDMVGIEDIHLLFRES
jgi:hypothetical protein